MTIASTTNRSEYTGSGSTATFSYLFKVFQSSELRVKVKLTSTLVETTLTLTTDYTVTGLGVLAGGNVVLVNASQAWLDGSGFLLSTYTITIDRVMPLTQQTSITSQGDYGPEYAEKQFDRSVMIDQQQQREINQSLKLPITETGSAALTTLPNATDRASKALGFDASGNPTALTVTTVGAPTTATYICVTAQGDLSAERVLTGTANQITVTDNGANSTVVLSIPSNAAITSSSVTTGNATVSALTSGRVVLAGTAGLLEDDGGMTYAKATDILTVPVVKFTPGAAPSLANGQQWSDSTQLAPAYRTNGMTEYGVRCIYSQVSTVTVANTAVTTTLMTTPAFGSSTLPAALSIGKVIRVTGWGTYAITGTPTLNIALWYSNLGGPMVSVTETTAAASRWKFESTMTYTSATVAKTFCVLQTGTSTGANYAGGAFSAGGSTMAADVIGLSATWGAASTSNTISCEGITMEMLG